MKICELNRYPNVAKRSLGFPLVNGEFVSEKQNNIGKVKENG